ncbi:MAG: glucose-1-phosphate adenylyltransferase [Planctomycetes bacterium]|nr:glucose-1-phosphate adenylyltransferase [Planctomycetota bacterium]
MSSVISLILGGGRGERLFPLTKLRSKPAVPVAGKYRLIDIPISNCINSGMHRIYVLTQFMSVSLHRHIANTYKFDMFDGGFVELLAAQQTIEGSNWYQGTADAVRQNIRQIEEDPGDLVLILSGDQLYRMDFRQLVKTHLEAKADATIAVLPVKYEMASSVGIIGVNENGRIVRFIEKPQTKEKADECLTPESWIEKQGFVANGRNYLASMGIYLFKKDVLLKMLQSAPLEPDFGKHIFPRYYDSHPIHVHLFDDYWEDLGTIKSYHESSLALASDSPPFDFSDSKGVIYTRMRFLPAARVADAVLRQCLISDGCVVLPGTTIDRALLGVRCRIGRNTVLREAVIIGADRFESDEERENNRKNGRPSFNVGDGCVIERAILDKDCRVGNNVRITNHRNIQREDGKFYSIRDGIVVIPKGAEVPDNTVI